jgi:hypothetical protein
LRGGAAITGYGAHSESRYMTFNGSTGWRN